MMSSGHSYTVEVPDTLDLAGRAALSAASLTNFADKKAKYESFTCAHVDQKPPYFNHRGGGPCWPKQLHPIPMMRIMSGTSVNSDYDAKMLQAVLDHVESDGLIWLTTKNRPWDEEVYKKDIHCTGSQSRFIVALLDWSKYYKDERLLKVAERLVHGTAALATRNEGRAWYSYFRNRQDWQDDTSGSVDSIHTKRVREEEEPAIPCMYSYGQPRRAMARWVECSGVMKALELAHQIARLMLKSLEADSSPDWPSMMDARRRGYWAGHFHTWTMGMIGMTEYAIITNNVQAKQYAQEFFEFARLQGIGKIGFFPGAIGELKTLRENVTKTYGEFPGQACEGCSIGDMIHIAVCLSEAGIGDYWDDVDHWVRNHLVEHQWLRRDLLEAMVAAGPEHKLDPRIQTEEDVVERSIGWFGSITDPTWLYGWATACCNTNMPTGMYKAWASIIRPLGSGVQINLLLNRASEWADLESWLPYEGKFVLRNKTAKKAYIRIPKWVDKKALRCRVNDKVLSSHQFLNAYLVIEDLKPRDVATVEFPVPETTEKYKEMSYGKEYTCQFRGSTLVDISPKGDRPGRTVDLSDDGDKFPVNKGYPIYQRDHLKAKNAPYVRKRQFVSDILI